MKILITGIGGPAGICFAKSLYKIKGVKLIGSNAERTSIADKFLKEFYLVPFAKDHNFLDSICKIVENDKIDLKKVFVIEPEIEVFESKKPYNKLKRINDTLSLHEKIYKILPEFSISKTLIL